MNSLFTGENPLPGPNTPSLNLARKIFKGLASESEIDYYMKEYASFGEKRMGKPMMLMSWEETITCRVINENNKEGDLEGGDCPLCKNRFAAPIRMQPSSISRDFWQEEIFSLPAAACW